MVCAFTKFIKGIVIKDNNPETIINGLHEAWCLNVGFPTVWFWEINDAKCEVHQLANVAGGYGEIFVVVCCD